MGEVLDAKRTEMFDLVDSETIRASGAIVAAIPNGLGDDVWGERRGRRVQRAVYGKQTKLRTILGQGSLRSQVSKKQSISCGRVDQIMYRLF